MPRWRVLLTRSGGDAVDGHFDHVNDDFPLVGAIIDVRNRRERGSPAIRARVQHVDASDNLPIAAVEIRRDDHA